jgi:hypothetical protein
LFEKPKIFVISEIFQDRYQGTKITNITQIIIKRYFKIVSKLFFITDKYIQIVKATKNNTSYLNHRKLDILG